MQLIFDHKTRGIEFSIYRDRTQELHAVGRYGLSRFFSHHNKIVYPPCFISYIKQLLILKFVNKSTENEQCWFEANITNYPLQSGRVTSFLGILSA